MYLCKSSFVRVLFICLSCLHAYISFKNESACEIKQSALLVYLGGLLPLVSYKLKEKEIWLSNLRKVPIPTENPPPPPPKKKNQNKTKQKKTKKKQTNKQTHKWENKNAIKKYDFTTLPDRLRTVSWNNYSHPTDTVKQVYGYPK